MLVLAFNLVSNLVQHQSGLLRVTVAGVVIGNKNLVEREFLRHIDENLSLLSPSVLVIVIPSQPADVKTRRR